MKVKPIATIVSKWNSRAQGATQAYQDGINNPKKDWAANTAAASNAWQQGVQQAAANGTFSSGVSKAGNTTWQQGALNKGASRYGPGITAGQSKFSNNIQKYIGVLQNLTLPPRAAKGDPSNWARSQAVGTALHAAKIGK